MQVVFPRCLIPCVLSLEDAGFVAGRERKKQTVLGDLLTLQGSTGQESEVLLILTFFVASAGLCASAAFCSQSFVSVDLVSFL